MERHKNKKLLFIILFLYIFYLNQVSSNICTIDDYKIKLYPCDKETQTRNISIYLSSKCSLPNNITKDNPIYPYYTLPTYNVSCIDCSNNEKIVYNPQLNNIICQKCPNNTYSSKDFKIVENWSEEIINQNFIVKCISVGQNDYKEDKDCTKLTITKNKTFIESGTLLGDRKKYIIQIIILFHSENWGKFILSYKKDTKNYGIYSNGALKIYYDYDLIKYDYKENQDYIDFSYDFPPGDHQILILYNYDQYDIVSPMKLYIKSLELINIRDSPTECKMKNDICPLNHYFNKENNTCIKCEDNEFVLYGLTSLYKCVPKKECSKYDIEIIDIGKCDPISKTKIIRYDFISSQFCFVENDHENKFEKEKKIKCENKEINFEEKCIPGHRFSYDYRLDLSNIKLSEFFDENNGWYSNEEEIYTGIYNIVGEKKELVKLVKINEINSYICFDLELNLQKGEEFNIIINSNNTHKFNSENSQKIKYFLNISLIEIDNKIELTYIKNSQIEINYKNPVLIKNIRVHGSSDLFTEKKLVPCAIDEISLDDCSKCKKCGFNYDVDKKNNKCVLSNGKVEKMDRCPSYTYENNNKCILNEILHQSEEKIKINLSLLKQYQKYICKELSGNICYENDKFIGPIAQYGKNNKYIINNLLKNLEENNYTDIKEMELMKFKNPLFFISIFEPSSISLIDYLYFEKENSLPGHIFALFSPEKKSNFLFSENSINDENEENNNNSFTFSKKLKITISYNIEKIFIISKTLNARYKSGLLIEFSEGDKCLNDYSRKYKAYIYLKCAKYQISFPELIDTFDNECTFLFQWDTPYACKNCLTKDIGFYEVTKCKNGIRNYLFSSNEECIIFNGSDPTLKGYNISYNDKTINFEDDLLQKLFFKKDLKRKVSSSSNMESTETNKLINIKNEKQLKKFKFDFIEKEIYQEKCYFYDDFSFRVKLIILVITCIYIIVIILTIIYCCKYKSIKNKYERIKNRNKSKDVPIHNQKEFYK